jgi:hypothetical protein
MAGNVATLPPCVPAPAPAPAEHTRRGLAPQADGNAHVHMYVRMAQLFQEAQADAGCHRKNALAMRKHYKLRPKDDANADLVQCLHKVGVPGACRWAIGLLMGDGHVAQILAVKKRERAVELSLDYLLACVPLVDQAAGGGSQSAAPALMPRARYMTAY